MWLRVLEASGLKESTDSSVLFLPIYQRNATQHNSTQLNTMHTDTTELATCNPWLTSSSWSLILLRRYLRARP